MSKFQIILTAIFGVSILTAVAVFALYRGGAGSNAVSIKVWGDLPSEAFGQLLSESLRGIDENLSVSYVEKDPSKIDAEFTEALAVGAGPDLIIITQDNFWKNRTKLLPVSYESVGARDFKEAFVEEGELFLTSEGIYALPLAIDPLVLYYNRDILTFVGEAKPIGYWDEIYSLTQKLTVRDGAGNITRSAIALGETRNIANYKEIMSLLLLQAGNKVMVPGFNSDELRSALNDRTGSAVSSGEAALNFYTQFSNPSKAYYSWNRSLPEALDRFTSGDSAYYLGFASELTKLRNKNPNLNLGLALVPQSRVSGKRVTYGKVYGVAITRGARNYQGALRAATILVSKQLAGPLSEKLALPPARRDLLSQKRTDNIWPVFYEAALQSRGWLDPENAISGSIFKEMIDSVTSGRARTSEALTAAAERLEKITK